jgi:hypothetical protein
MKTITLEIDNTIYEHFIGVINAIKGVRISRTADTFPIVAEESAAYNTPETEAQRERREYFTSICGAIWTSKGIENTEAELKAMREEWDRNF